MMIRELKRKTFSPIYYVLDIIKNRRGQRMMMAYSLRISRGN